MTVNKPFDARRAVLAGLAGSAAYLAEHYLDLKLLRFPGDDLKLLGMVATRRDPAWRVAGVAAHCANGTALAIVYGLVARDRLPGPPAVRGLLMGQLENGSCPHLMMLVGSLSAIYSEAASHTRLRRPVSPLARLWGVLPADCRATRSSPERRQRPHHQMWA